MAKRGNGRRSRRASRCPTSTSRRLRSSGCSTAANFSVTRCSPWRAVRNSRPRLFATWPKTAAIRARGRGCLCGGWLNVSASCGGWRNAGRRWLPPRNPPWRRPANSPPATRYGRRSSRSPNRDLIRLDSRRSPRPPISTVSVGQRATCKLISGWRWPFTRSRSIKAGSRKPRSRVVDLPPVETRAASLERAAQLVAAARTCLLSAADELDRLDPCQRDDAECAHDLLGLAGQLSLFVDDLETEANL